MLKRTGISILVLIGVLGIVLLVDWQTSKGSVVTKDGVTLIEDNRLRLFGSESIAGVGINGTLELLPSGCVGLSSTHRGGATSLPVIWQHGSNLISAKPLRIRFGGHTYGEGDQINAGGYDATAAGEAFYGDIPAACKSSKYIFLRVD